MNYEELKRNIADVVKPNGNQEITGQIMQDALFALIENLGEGWQFGGAVRPSDVPALGADVRGFWLAVEKGVYADFGGVEVTELSAIVYSDGWAVLPLGVAFGVDTEAEIGALSERVKALEADGSVTTSKIKNGAVTTEKLADESVTKKKLGAKSVTISRIADGAVTTPKIADGAVTEKKIADGSITGDKFSAGLTLYMNQRFNYLKQVQVKYGEDPSAEIKSFAQRDNKTALYIKLTNGLLVPANTNGETVSGLYSYGNTIRKVLFDGTNWSDIEIQNDIIDTEHIKDYAVIGKKISSGAITNNKIRAGAVSIDKLNTDLQSKVNDNVKYVEQNLTDAQKAQARKNIDVDYLTEDEVANLWDTTK